MLIRKNKFIKANYIIIPIEKDVLTLDDESGFRNLMLQMNFNTLTLVKHSLQRLEALYGKIPLKYAKGSWSCMIIDAITGKDKESKAEKDEENQYSEIDALIMLDRSVDLVTPLVTQMTFEGIIDEFFSIQCGAIEVDSKVLDPEMKGPAGTKKLYLTNAEDIMFAESRDLHFNIMKEHFPRKFQEMKSLCEKKDSVKTLAEMTDYMKKLRNLKIPQLQTLFTQDFNLLVHLDGLVIKHNIRQLMAMEPRVILSDSLPKDVLEFLELEIAKCEEKERLMRLLCLISVINNGIPKDQYALLTKEYVDAKEGDDAFGIAELLRILNLERAGILKQKGSGSFNWTKLKDSLKLLKEDVDIQNPNDLSYAYSGYAPISLRLIEKLLMQGWNIPELDMLPGPKRVPADEKAKLRKLFESDKQNDRKKVILQ